MYLVGSLGGGGGIGGGPTTDIVVAKQSIPFRHQITVDDLTTAKVSSGLVNTYTKQGDVVGKIAEIQITKGSIITSDMLAIDIGLVSAGAAPAYLPLASGYVAIQ